MLNKLRAVLANPFVGLIPFLLFFASSNSFSIGSQQTASLSSYQISDSYDLALVVHADDQHSHNFSGPIKQVPTSEEENEESDSEKEDMLLAYLEKSVDTYFLRTQNISFRQIHQEVQVLHTEPLYVLHHSWKSNLV